MTVENVNVLALDFGGTKLASAVIDPRTGKIRSLVRRETPGSQGAQASIALMFEIGAQALKEAGLTRPDRVGISFGGPVSKDRKKVLISNHVADWQGIPLPQLASDQFGCPSFMDNDANIAALGSWQFDTYALPENFIYIQISTGIGSGIIIDRHLYRGGSIAGEIGHVTVYPDGPECVCGKHGCLESLSAGWALARAGREILKTAGKNTPLFQLSEGNPENINARILIQAAETGDRDAKAAVNHAFTALGIAVANMISLFDPQVVMLGGGVTRAQTLMRSILEPTLDLHLHPLFKGRFQLNFSGLEGKETLLGAALLDD